MLMYLGSCLEEPAIRCMIFAYTARLTDYYKKLKVKTNPNYMLIVAVQQIFHILILPLMYKLLKQSKYSESQLYGLFCTLDCERSVLLFFTLYCEMSIL